MPHEPCQCDVPNANCPRYGWMKGRKWEVCQGKENTTDRRDELLEAYAYGNTKKDSDPPLAKQIVNYIDSTIKHALNMFEPTSEQEREARLDICNSCDQLSPEKNCRACGCPVNDKASRASELCPLLKWPGNDTLKSKGCGCGS